MIVIVCLDERKGMMFNRRRVSRDRAVVEKIGEICQNRRLWVHPYSLGLFEGEGDGGIANAEEAFLEQALPGDVCFVENQELKPYEESIEQLVVFWWNRRYPADRRLDLDLDSWKKVSEEEFPGFSHEKITKEVYER